VKLLYYRSQCVVSIAVIYRLGSWAWTIPEAQQQLMKRLRQVVSNDVYGFNSILQQEARKISWEELINSLHLDNLLIKRHQDKMKCENMKPSF
jgi:hypothetical protein